MPNHVFKLLDEKDQSEWRSSQIEKALSEGQSMQEALGISCEQMHLFYEYAQELFADKAFTDCADILLVLSLLNPYVYATWLSLGITENLNRNYSESQMAFQMAMLLNENSPIPYMEQIHNSREQRENDLALEYIQLMEQCIEETTENEPYFKEARSIKENIRMKIFV